MSKYDLASERFSTAVRTLAVRDLPLKERLASAVESIRGLDAEHISPLRQRRPLAVAIAKSPELSVFFISAPST